jgi:WD40 repeat protein
VPRLVVAVAVAFLLAALAGAFAFVAMDSADRARSARDSAERERAAALIDSARASIERNRHLEAKAKLRTALELGDSALARLLWWRLESDALVWERSLGTGLFDVAVAPTFDRFAAAGQDRSIRVYDTTLLTSTRLRGHGDQVVRLAFSPDGRLASAGATGEVRLWDLASGSSRVVSSGGERAVGLAFLPEGLIMVFAGGTVRRLEDGLERTGSAARDAAISDRAIAIASDDTVELLDPRSFQTMSSIPLLQVSAVALSQKGTIAAATRDGEVLILEGEEPKRYAVHPGMILRLAFDQRGRLVSAGQDGSVRLLEPASGDVRIIAQHQGAVWGLACAKDEVLSGSIDRKLALHRLDAPPPPTEGHRGAVTATAFTDRGVVSGGVDRRVLAWSDDGNSARELLVEEATILGLASKQDRLATASREGTVRLLELATGRQLASYGDHAGAVYAVALSSDARTVASAGADGTVRLFSLDRGMTVLEGHKGSVLDVSMADDGRIASAGADTTVRTWDANGRPLKVFRGHRDKVWAVAFGPQGGLFSASADGTIRAWSEAGQDTLLGRHEGRVYSIAIDRSGSQIASAGTDGAFLWTPGEGRKVRLSGHAGEVNEIRFSPAGPQVAGAGDDGTVRVWDLDGTPRWWASLFDAGQLATPSGWRDARGRIESETPWAKPAKRARRGAVARTHACLMQREDRLELWWEEKSPRWSVVVPGIRDVRAVEHGCVALAKNAALYPIQGPPKELAPIAHAIAVTDSAITVATDDRIARFNVDGTPLFERPYGGGAVAIATAGDEVVIGYADGGIERTGRPLGFDSTPASRVVRLEIGPMDVVIAGFEDGTFGLWDLASGIELTSLRVHGPATSIDTVDRRISFASELGAYGGAINTFSPSYCMLLRAVWQEVPQVWREGGIIASPPDRGHPCAPQ